jgi:hypothetical protein
MEAPRAWPAMAVSEGLLVYPGREVIPAMLSVTPSAQPLKGLMAIRVINYSLWGKGTGGPRGKRGPSPDFKVGILHSPLLRPLRREVVTVWQVTVFIPEPDAPRVL